MSIEQYNDRVGTSISEYKSCQFDNPFHSSTLKTDITFIDLDGDVILKLTKHKANMTVLGGRISILEKMFGITPNPEQRLLLNNLIPRAKLSSDLSEQEFETPLNHSASIFTGGATNPNRFNSFVKYFCIGNKGENPNVPYTILDAHDWETYLYGMVPFRFVPISDDLTSEEQTQYRLRKRIELAGSQYYGYYAKKFDPGVIHSIKSDADYIPNIDDSLPYVGDAIGHNMKGHNSKIYIDFELEVTENEFKEFYRATHNNTLSGARLTELGLIQGLDAANTLDGGRLELADATLFAKLIHDPVFMSSEGSRRKVGYKVFA